MRRDTTTSSFPITCLSWVVAALSFTPGCVGGVGDVPPPGTLYEVGTSQANAVETTFRVLADGDPVEVVRGGQGSLMVVAAARTNRFAADLQWVTVDATLERADGGDYAHFRIRRQIYAGADGVATFGNLFLVMDESQPWEGRDAVLVLRLTAPDGTTEVEDAVTVHLVPGPPVDPVFGGNTKG